MSCHVTAPITFVFKRILEGLNGNICTCSWFDACLTSVSLILSFSFQVLQVFFEKPQVITWSTFTKLWVNKTGWKNLLTYCLIRHEEGKQTRHILTIYTINKYRWIMLDIRNKLRNEVTWKVFCVFLCVFFFCLLGHPSSCMLKVMKKLVKTRKISKKLMKVLSIRSKDSEFGKSTWSMAYVCSQNSEWFWVPTYSKLLWVFFSTFEIELFECLSNMVLSYDTKCLCTKFIAFCLFWM